MRRLFCIVATVAVLALLPSVLTTEPVVAAPPYCTMSQTPSAIGDCLPTAVECASGGYDGNWIARRKDGSIVGEANCDSEKGGRILRYVAGTAHPVCGVSAEDDRLRSGVWIDPNECLVPVGEPEAGTALKGPRFGEAVSGTRGVVASPSFRASKVGVEMLARGNAVDAAVATALAAGVARPEMCGIGGGGNLLVRKANGEAYALDFQRSGPASLGKTTYSAQDFDDKAGHKVVGVPGMIAGMDAVLKKLGTRTLAEALEGAIELAEKGIIVSEDVASWTQITSDNRSLDKYSAFRELFFRKNLRGEDVPYPPGSTLVQEEYAESLRAIHKEGPAAFYVANGVPNDGVGDVADLIVAEMDKTKHPDALITKEDLSSYKPVWREPVAGSYHHHDVLTMPAPTLGYSVQQMLNILAARDDLDLVKSKIRHSTADWAHVLTEVHKIAIADWAWAGDPAFATVPMDKLTSKPYARLRAAEIDLNAAKDFQAGTFEKSAPKSERSGGGHTVHVSVIDAAGTAVALTCSLGVQFGSLVVPAGAGFVLNENTGYSPYDAEAQNDSDPNLAGPGKRASTAHSPTILVRDGRAVLVLGAAGGDFIPTGVVNAIVNFVDYGMDPAHAVDAARVQANPLTPQSRRRSVFIEDGRIADSEIRKLVLRGHPVTSSFCSPRGCPWNPAVPRHLRQYFHLGPWVQAVGECTTVKPSGPCSAATARWATADSRSSGFLDRGAMAQP